jgi:hypothetical protein
MKKFRIALLVALLTLGLTLPATAATIGYNGSNLGLPAASQVVGGQTMVPAVWLGQLMGLDVSLDEGARTATLSKNATTVVFTLGKKTVKLNNRSRTVRVAPLLAGSEFLVPLKATAEFFGAKVTYDKAKNQAQLTLQEKKDGQTPTEWLAASSVAMQKLESYRMSGKMDMNLAMGASGETMNFAFSALINGAVKMPDEVYTRIKLVMPALFAEEGDDLVAESYLKGTEIYTKSAPDEQWQKMDSPLTAEMMATSLTQNPAQIKAMLDKFGLASSFGSDKMQGGSRIVVVNSQLAPDTLVAMLQEVAAKSGEKLDTAEIMEVFQNMQFNLGVRSYIDSKTKYTLWSDIYGTIVVTDQGTTVEIDMSGIIDFGGFDEAVQMPDVSGAVPAP